RGMEGQHRLPGPDRAWAGAAQLRARGGGARRRPRRGGHAGPRTAGAAGGRGGAGRRQRTTRRRRHAAGPALALRDGRRAAAQRARRPRSGASDPARCTRHSRAARRDGTPRCLIARGHSPIAARCPMLLATTPSFEPLRSLDILPPVSGNAARAGARAREFLVRVREELRSRQDARVGGLALVAAYTDAIDRLVARLVADATLHYQSKNPRLNQRCTVVAQGGYGRGELNVHSDIDLLFLYPWKVNPYVETVAEIVVPALWDAVLQVGSAMRNVR